MQKVINLLRGSVRLEAQGAFPERFINLCAQEEVRFWELAWQDEHTIRLCVSARNASLLEEISRRSGCQVRTVCRTGLPYFLIRFRRRYALLAGMALALAAVCVLSQFILTVEVRGNERVPTGMILEQLRRQGVYPGAYGPHIDEGLAGSGVLLELRELVWISVNLHGTRAEVLVRERSPRPEIVDESVPCHVTADAPGVITRVETLSGQPLVQPGDTVTEGEILISGIIDLKEPLYAQVDLGTVTVHAQGKVYADTLRTMRAVLPLQGQIKEYTGQIKRSWSLSVLEHRLHLWGEREDTREHGERYTKTHVFTLPGGRTLPLALICSTQREYTLKEGQLDRTAAEEMLRAHLLKRLEQLMSDREGTVAGTEFSVREENGLLEVCLQARCSEQVGRESVFEGTVGRSEPSRAGPLPEN